jgi:hypothetical protein
LVSSLKHNIGLARKRLAFLSEEAVIAQEEKTLHFCMYFLVQKGSN